MRAGAVVTAAVLGLVCVATPGGAQAFEWRLGGGASNGWIGAAEGSTGGTSAAVVSASLERSLSDRFSVGLEWQGVWYGGGGFFGDQQRQSLTLNGSVWAWSGLHLVVGAGPGIASWLSVEGPPSDGVGDVLVSFSEGDPAMVWTGGLGYDLPLGPFQLTPQARFWWHQLHGTTLRLTSLGARLWLRTER